MSATVQLSTAVAGSASYAPGVGSPIAGQSIALPHYMGIQLQPGTAADQCSKVARVYLTFVASTMQSINLQSMLAPDGSAVSFSGIRYYEITILDQVDGVTLTLAPDGTNGWTDGPFTGTGYVMQAGTANNPVGGFVAGGAPNTTGWAVTGSNRVLDLTPSAAVFSAWVTFVGY